MRQNESINEVPQALFSCGSELLPNGDSLHLLRAGRLCFATKDKNEIGVSIKIDDRTFAATPLSAAFATTLRLPDSTEEHGSTPQLHARLSQVFRGLAGLEDSAAQLVATYVLSTHLRGAIVDPLLNIWGPGASGSTLVQLIAALCRHPLPVTDLRFNELLRLPVGLAPTLVLADPQEELLRRVLTCRGAGGFATLRSGELTHLSCGVVACSPRPLSLPALPLPIVESQVSLRPIAPGLLESFAEEYQPLCLDFRARCWQAAAESTFDVPEFSSSTRAIARSLGAALCQAPALQRSLIAQLQGVDQQIRLERSQSTVGVVLEVLLHLVHSGSSAAYLHDVAETANVVFAGRYEKAQLTPKAVSRILRDQGFSTKRASAGYQVVLDGAANRRIHQLAEEFGVSNAAAGDCTFCSGEVGAQAS